MVLRIYRKYELRNGLYDLLRNSLSTYIFEEVQFHLLCKEN